MRIILIVVSFVLSTVGDLIPRELLLEDAKYSSVSLSPDGRLVAFLSPNEFGVKNVYVKCVTCEHDALPVTFENRIPVDGYHWTGVPNIILYYNDRDGDEKYRLFKVNITEPSPSNQIHTISDTPGVMALVIKCSYHGQHAIIAMNDEMSAFDNIYQLDLITNEMRLILSNNRFATVFVDNDLRIRLVSEESADGSLVYYRPADCADSHHLRSKPEDWTEYLRVPPADRGVNIFTEPVGFTADNKRIYWMWGIDSDLGQLVVHEFGRPTHNKIIYKAKRGSIYKVMLHPTNHTVMAVMEIYHKMSTFEADVIAEDVRYLKKLRPCATLEIESFSQDFNTWLVSYDSSDRPIEYFLYDRRRMRADFLFSERPSLAGRRLNQMVGFEFAARDGLRIQAYLCLPPDTQLMSRDKVSTEPHRNELAKLDLLPVDPQKLVVLVHGWPQSRDLYGFSSLNALLTDRGYAVLLVNYRGSSLFGKRFENAGNGEWGGKMQTDLLDAVDYLVKGGVADRQHIAIMGSSYGGYAALVGATKSADVFACAVDIVGLSNLISFQSTVAPYWKVRYPRLVMMLGADGNTEAGRRFLASRSPLFFASRVRNPLLMIHGANDPRIQQAESDQFVAALETNKIPVTYVLFPDEGHGMKKPRNRMATFGFIEQFLHKCLGGKLEPFRLGQYNSSATVMTESLKNRNHIAGLR